MTSLLAAVIAVAWIACAASSYTSIRNVIREENGEWSTGDRRLWLFLSLALGWILFLWVRLVGVGSLMDRVIGALFDNESPASW